MQINFAETDEEMRRCFPVIVQLRPHLTLDAFVEQVKRQSQQADYRLVYVEEGGEVEAVAGFRIAEMLSRGRFLYIDDFVTDARERSKGYGSLLFDRLVAYAKSQQRRQLDLDSGVQRVDTHRFYLGKGMHISGYHFSLKLDESPVREENR